MKGRRAQPILRTSGPTLRAARVAAGVGLMLLGLSWGLSWLMGRLDRDLLPGWGAHVAWMLTSQGLPMAGGVLVAWWIFVSTQVRIRTRRGGSSTSINGRAAAPSRRALPAEDGSYD
ncbi:MAG: hypothetical protein LBV06_08865 [Propionibacteriaceae bacterium]|jgi:hypothetical protein|nr:hypothetical protein [Propionibacteriaceae bacterium]